MVQDRAILTMADYYKVLCDLSIGAIFNDLERSWVTCKNF